MDLKKLRLLAIVSSYLIGYSCGGVGAGWFFYAKYGAPWWVLLLFSLTGLCLAFYRIYQVSQKELE
jgi:F0F1-type ATP synthase assembly protein I